MLCALATTSEVRNIKNLSSVPKAYKAGITPPRNNLKAVVVHFKGYSTNSQQPSEVYLNSIDELELRVPL